MPRDPRPPEPPPPGRPPPPPTLRTVCVFCGASPGTDPAYLAAARDFGALLAREGRTLVYGGGRVGMMGAVADAALEAGGRVIGVIPRTLVDRELAHTGATEMRVVGSLHERKATMAALSDAFVALPGGIGTMEELFEAWTWGQLGLHGKPLGLLDAAGYFAPLLAFLDSAVRQGFLSADARSLLAVDDRSDRLLRRLEALPPSSLFIPGEK